MCKLKKGFTVKANLLLLSFLYHLTSGLKILHVFRSTWQQTERVHKSVYTYLRSSVVS